MKRNSNNAFTLVEMLAVLVIMGIMIGIGIVAFTRVAQGAKLQTAGRELFNTMRLARQYAITHRINTAVVYTYEATPNSDQAPPLRSYSVMTNGSVVGFASPTGSGYLTGWRSLPEGLVFDFAHGVTPPPTINTVPFPNNTGANQLLRYLSWSSSGSLEQYDRSKFHVREGFLTGTTPTFTSSNAIEFALFRLGGAEMTYTNLP